MARNKPFPISYVLWSLAVIAFFIWKVFFQAEPENMTPGEVIESVSGFGLETFPLSTKQFYAHKDDRFKTITYDFHFIAPCEETKNWIDQSEGLQKIVPKKIDMNGPDWPRDCAWAGTGKGMGNLYEIPNQGNWVAGFLCINPQLESVFFHITLDL